METGHRPIPNRLRLHRKRVGYTQLYVAELMGLYDSVSISLWERGAMLPNTINLIKLSAIFRTFPNELYPELFKEEKEKLTALEHQLASQQ
ncbi:helix-turn-helix transcriptional regulator [Mucilaginibacter sp.]|uniref:helix-turn-helix domain-containing protein n=1 Tax=Mucilaginibacter sp. TaxID=1882438 RepID=UPI00261E00A3|nr:helix-turn-helix transcriptional regulator [Mucilaginibacter sp.]